MLTLLCPAKVFRACVRSDGPKKPVQWCILTKTFLIHQGPVVQSIVSLTSSLRVISLTVLADSIYNILIFFAEKM